jgi:hypothetical protein
LATKPGSGPGKDDLEVSSMRTSILLLVALLAFGCSSKKASENDTGSNRKIGVIVAREDVEMMSVEEETRTNTSAYGGVSSGGGFSIGLGILFSPRTSGSSSRVPMRYEVELQNEGRITVYHDSYEFQIGDCVEISLYPDEEEHSPAMKRIKGGC